MKFPYFSSSPMYNVFVWEMFVIADNSDFCFLDDKIDDYHRYFHCVLVRWIRTEQKTACRITIITYRHAHVTVVCCSRRISVSK